MGEEARWYVIHTYSGYENKVAANLEKIVENRKMEHLIQDMKIPCETVIEKDSNNRTKEVERKIFPSYVLVKMIMTDESWHIVRNIRGVTAFVGPGSKPIPLTDEEITKFDIENIVIELKFAVGDSVKVTEGSLANSVGVIVEISDDNKRAKVAMSMFGRQTTIEMDANALESIKV